MQGWEWRGVSDCLGQPGRVVRQGAAGRRVSSVDQGTLIVIKCVQIIVVLRMLDAVRHDTCYPALTSVRILWYKSIEERRRSSKSISYVVQGSGGGTFVSVAVGTTYVMRFTSAYTP